jgi:peroxiredoxin
MRLLTLLLLTAACTFGAGELSGRRAPGFSLPENPRTAHDPQDYRGKVLIVDFMQVACHHCATFSGVLEKAKAKFGDRIAVLSIVNPPSTTEEVAAFKERLNLTTPILFDCGQVAFSYMKPTSPQILIPHVFLIDGDGMIRNDFGYSEANKEIFEGEALFAEIQKLLSPKPVVRE